MAIRSTDKEERSDKEDGKSHSKEVDMFLIYTFTSTHLLYVIKGKLFLLFYPIKALKNSSFNSAIASSLYFREKCTGMASFTPHARMIFPEAEA